MHYSVLHKETDADKYASLHLLIEQRDRPAIVYVSRTKRTRELAQKLTDDGFPALPFNGKMDPEEKIGNQEAFIRNDVRVIVATSAFGMGVDKKDVVLDFFLDKKSVVVGLMSGDALKVDGNYLVSSVGGRMVRVAKFSQSFIQKLSELADKGYRPQFAKVQYVVAWRKNEEAAETAIILPDLHLSSVWKDIIYEHGS